MNLDNLIDNFKIYGMDFSKVSYSTIINLMKLLTSLENIINSLKINVNENDELIKHLLIEIKILKNDNKNLINDIKIYKIGDKIL